MRRAQTDRTVVSPLDTWFADGSVVGRFRDSRLAGGAVAFPPRDRVWRVVAPDFATAVKMAVSGLPVQIAVERRYERTPTPHRVRLALAEGATVFLP
ncbi:MAG TPA: hypothetical protein VFO18_07490, partial [Methylomirabilota bacterium]|nr:hypothetical protein [Methylomirabilota bacterium]